MEPNRRNIIMPEFDEMKNDVISGMDLKEIAAKYDVAYTTAYGWAKHYGFQVDNMGTHPPPLMELVDLTKRFSRSKVGEMYNVSAYIITSWLMHYGIVDKPSLRGDRIPESVREYAIHQYFLGLWDVEDIAEEYGISVRGVYSDIKAHSHAEDTVHMMPEREELLKDYENMDLKQLAEYYGTTQPQIVKWFRSLSIKQKEVKQNV